MKQGIQSAGAKFVPVAGQFLDKPQAEDRSPGGMVKDMKANQAAVKVLLILALSRSLLHPVDQISVMAMAMPTPTTHPATTFRKASTEIIPSTHFPESVPKKAERVTAKR